MNRAAREGDAPTMLGAASPRPEGERCDRDNAIGLRAWFAAFLAWLITLTLVAVAALDEAEHGSPVGMAVWLLAVYAFYLSLCCTFFPAPTTWIVLLLASNAVAAQVGVEAFPITRLIVAATLGALSTGLANLNEYHLWTWLLRFRAVGRVRETRLYNVADRWFATNPFLVLGMVSLIPIPVDVIRWLAVASRYPRWRFFWAYFIGRWVRYAGWCVMSMGLALKFEHIAAIQMLLVVAAGVRVVPGLVRQIRQDRSQPAVPADALANR
jgi:membrane protein YqaA with SNARE-associated domain